MMHTLQIAIAGKLPTVRNLSLSLAIKDYNEAIKLNPR